MEKRFENFTIAILKLNKLVQKIKLHEMKEFDLKAIHVMCIYYLGGSSHGLTATELARLTLEDKAAISRALQLLDARGYIKYNGSGYGATITLTAEGEKVADFIADKANIAVDAGGGRLTESERENFYKSLNIISEDLEKYYNTLSKTNGEDDD
jgi:DNA-binding MarR family transcriptional regulator